MYTRFPSLIVSIGATAFDADAQSFITTAGITNNTQKNAINTLVLAYKSAGIWTKMSAIYPLVGGTSTTHSYNLKNPSQFQITWSGSVTHDSNGVTGNGTTGYGDTGIIPSTSLTLENVHISCYNRTGNVRSHASIGAGTSGTNRLKIASQTTATIRAFLNSTIASTFNVTNFIGSFVITKSSANNGSIWRNTTESNATNTTTSLPSNSIFILADNNWGGANEYSNDNYAMFTIGTSLNSTDVLNKYTADQAFQTSLGRNV